MCGPLSPIGESTDEVSSPYAPVGEQRSTMEAAAVEDRDFLIHPDHHWVNPFDQRPHRLSIGEVTRHGDSNRVHDPRHRTGPQMPVGVHHPAGICPNRIRVLQSLPRPVTNPRAPSSMAEQRTFNPQVQGSSPWGPTYETSRSWALYLDSEMTAF